MSAAVPLLNCSGATCDSPRCVALLDFYTSQQTARDESIVSELVGQSMTRSEQFLAELIALEQAAELAHRRFVRSIGCAGKFLCPFG